MDRRVFIGASILLSLSLNSTAVYADVFKSRYDVFQETSTPSIVGAFVMGARGYMNYVPPSGMNWRIVLRDTCQISTTSRLGYTSLWSNGCDPKGMAQAISSVAGQRWVVLTFAESAQADAMNESINSLTSSLQSPFVVPIFGQADHWATVWSINATRSVTGTGYSLNTVTFYDALGESTDSGSNIFYRGQMTFNGLIWQRMYFGVINAINASCDPNCTSDPFFKKFVVTYDPPTSLRSTDAVVPHFSPVAAPGLIAANSGALGFGQRMSSELAQRGVLTALKLAGLDKDSEIYGIAAAGTAGVARLVQAKTPGGLPWNYYLVPIHDRSGAVTAFIELDAEDGAFQGSAVFERPVEWQPVDPTSALATASQSVSRGEQLGAGILTWDPAVNDIHVKSPHLPFYSFPVLNRAGQASVRVTLNGGLLIREHDSGNPQVK